MLTFDKALSLLLFYRLIEPNELSDSFHCEGKWIVDDNVINRPVGWAVTHTPLEHEVRSSVYRPVKLKVVLPAARWRCDISIKEAASPAQWSGKETQTCHTLLRNSVCRIAIWILWFDQQTKIIQPL